jgi:hypothetical protein
MQNLQNKSNRVTSSATISSDTANYTLNTAKAPGYTAGTTDMTLTINPGIYVYSGSTGSYALTVDTSWASGDTVTIVNNGIIIGRGGNGGRGGDGATPPYNVGLAGSAAGPALLVQRALTMNNLNRISGGGGGGGGAGGRIADVGKTQAFYGGGGGGGGIGNSSGGPGGSGSGGPAPSGGSGSLTSPGSGGTGINGVPGGTGGSYGSSGANGGTSTYAGGGGGSAGACIVGDSNITYTNTGTRNGSIS